MHIGIVVGRAREEDCEKRKVGKDCMQKKRPLGKTGEEEARGKGCVSKQRMDSNSNGKGMGRKEAKWANSVREQ